MASIKTWVNAFRLKFLPQGILPVILATALAWEERSVFYFSYFALAFVGMALVQFGLTMLNDALDYLYGTDKSTLSEKNPYSGGSGVLAEGLVSPRQMFSMIVLFYLIAFGIGIYLAAVRGIEVIFIALLGFSVSVFYSAKPFRLAYRGIGELAMLLGYGPIITLGAYFVQAQAVAKEAFLIGLFPGMLMFAMIIINEIPDYEEDKRAGKRNIVSRVGRENGAKIFAGSLLSTYLLLLACIYLNVLPRRTIIAFLSLPAALSAIDYAKKYYNDKLKVAKANERMVLCYSLYNILLAIGLIIA